MICRRGRPGERQPEGLTGSVCSPSLRRAHETELQDFFQMLRDPGRVLPGRPRRGSSSCVLEISLQASTSAGPEDSAAWRFPASGILFSMASFPWPCLHSPLTACRAPRRPGPGD